MAFTKDNTPVQWRNDNYYLESKCIQKNDNHRVYTILLQFKHLLIRVAYKQDTVENDTFEIFPNCGLKGEYILYEDIDAFRIYSG